MSCEYCSKDSSFIFLSAGVKNGYTLLIVNGALRIEGYCGCEAVIEPSFININYCPFCGRKLYVEMVPDYVGLWSPGKAYKTLQIVRYKTGHDYFIARRNVPPGTDLSARMYWKPLIHYNAANYEGIFSEIKDSIISEDGEEGDE